MTEHPAATVIRARLVKAYTPKTRLRVGAGVVEFIPGPDEMRVLTERAALHYLAQTLEGSRDVRWVYFVQSGKRGPIKIGIAHDIAKRMAGISTASPHPVRLIAVTYGGRPVELFLHRLFVADRINGEWFRPSRRLRKVIHLLDVQKEVEDMLTPPSRQVAQ